MSSDLNNRQRVARGRTEATADLVRVNLLVPMALRKEWKAVALEADTTLTDLIIEAMRNQIIHLKAAEKL